jgi:hypothetical protein
LKKLDDQSAPLVFIGYFEGAKAYWMLEPDTGRVHVSCDIIFDENRGWEWDLVAQREFTVRYYTVQALADDIGGGVPEEGALPPSPGQAVPLLDSGTPPPVEQVPEFVAPIEDVEDRLDVFHNESPVRYRRIDSVIGNDLLVLGQAQWVLPTG